jgi:hypothetical protein
VGNQAQGLWFDTDNKNITISYVHLIGNKVANLQLEANPGPVSISNSSFCSADRGINVIDTQSITASSNVFYGNGANSGAAFFLAGNPGGRSIVDWESHQSYFLHTKNTTLKYNKFQSSGSGQNLFKTYLSSGDFSYFTANFTGTNTPCLAVMSPTSVVGKMRSAMIIRQPGDPQHLQVPAINYGRVSSKI